MAEIEGVIKYSSRCEQPACPRLSESLLIDCNRQRDRLIAAGIMGQQPDRYGGLGFGNLSWRIASGQPEFMVSGTQTGHLKCLQAEHIAHVVKADIPANALTFRGVLAPSSEALSHAALYACDTCIQAVVHVHAPDIWYHAAQLNLVQTPADVPYGTPAMAKALQAAWEASRNGKAEAEIVLVMAGHEDGVIATAASLVAATDALLRLQQTAEQI